jgi:hypothetical protein
MATTKTTTKTAAKTKPKGARELAAEILAENAGGPLPMKELAAEVVRRSKTLRGKTPEATASAHIYTVAKAGKTSGSSPPGRSPCSRRPRRRRPRSPARRRASRTA